MHLSLLFDPSVLLLLMSMGALYFDLTTGKIPNSWILLCLSAGALSRLVREDPPGTAGFFSGLLLPLLLLFPLFLTRMLGGGDIKLLSAAGALLGPSLFFSFLIRTLLFGALVSVPILLFRTGFLPRFRYFFRWILACRRECRLIPYIKKGDRPENIPFALPLFLCSLSAVIFPLKGVL